MNEDASPEAVAGAEAYEGLHVPALFREWVEPVLDAAGVREGHDVVDVACGTGVLARGALERVGSEGSVVGVDPDAGMLAVAARLAPAVDWRPGVAEELPVADAAADALVSQFGMMFFRDRAAAATEMLRALRPGGRVAVAVWDRLDRHPAYAAEVALLDAIAGRAAGDALRAPFVLGDPAEARVPFERAGFSDVRVETRVGTARFPSIRTMVEADLRGWLPVMGVHLAEATMEEVLDAADRELAGFVADGGVTFDSPAHLITGRKS